MAQVLTVAKSLIEAVNLVSKGEEAGTTLVQQASEIVDVTTAAVDRNIAKCKTLPDEKIEYGGQERRMLRDLKKIIKKTIVYVSFVKKLNRCGDDKARNKKIRKKLRRGDLTELSAFIKQQQKHLAKCSEAHRATQEAIKELISSAEEAAESCEKRAEEASMQRNASRVVGGAAATVFLAGGAIGGVVLSVVAGVFTFGIGTIVGLSLTAAGTMVGGATIGTATGVATHLYASNRLKLEEEFKTLEESFHQVRARATRIEDFIDDLQTLLELISNAIDDATPSDTYEESSDLVVAFDCVCEVFGRSHEAYVTCQQKLMKMDTELSERFKDLHIT